MRIFAATSVAVLSLFFFVSPSHAQSVELFGGYSFIRAPITFTQTPQGTCVVTGCPPTVTTQKINLNGFEVGGAFKVLGPLAIAADFGDTSGSFQGAKTHLRTYLVGPQLRLPGPISPFAHFLVGGAHESTSASTSPLLTTTSPTQNGFASMLGGGLDLKVLPLLSIRPIQVDYLLTHFNSATQNQFRVSAGVVVHF